MSIGLGVSNSISGKISGFGAAYDPDAQVYFTAVKDEGGSLTSLEKDLVNTWFVTERAAGRLSKYKAVYPFKGKTSGAAAINMVNPGTYDLSFNNFVTADFAVSGVLQGDGSTKYADVGTSLRTIFSSLFDYQMGVAYGTAPSSGVRTNIGAYNSSTLEITSIQTYTGTPTIHRAKTGGTVDNADINSTGNEGDLVIGGRFSATVGTVYGNGLQGGVDAATSETDFPDYSPYIFQRNDDGSPSTTYSGDELQLAILAEGLTQASMSDVSENFKSMIVDKDAQAYIQEVFDQGGSLTLAQQAAVNNLVKSMKADGLWDGVLDIFPYMGGTVDSAMLSLTLANNGANVNFTDSDVNPKIGIQPDGSTKWITMGVNASAYWASADDNQLGHFIQGGMEASYEEYFIGVFDTTPVVDTFIGVIHRSTEQARAYSGNVGITAAFTAAPNSFQSIIGGRYANNDLNLYLDGTNVATNTTTNSEPLPTLEMGVFARNLNGTFGANASSAFAVGTFFAEGWSENDVIKFEKLYKAFIQQVQDSETYDTDAAAYFIAVEDAGGTLTDNVKDEFDAFVVREKASGRWGKIKRLYPYMGGVINSAIIDAVTNNAATNSNFVDADADATIGLQGDGSTKYLTDVSTYSSIVSSQYKVQQGAIYIGETGETSIPYLFGAINSGNYIASRYFNSSLIRSYVGLVSPYSQYAATIPTSASVVAARYSTTSAYTIVNNNTDLQDTSSTTYSFPAVAPSYFKANGAGGISNGKYSCHFISEFDTLQETKDFTTSYKTFINNIQAYAALMDSYSGAATAYSLRKVYSTYEGSAINVRRSSDNATQDIGFDGYVLDEAALLSFVGAGNGFVTTWYDQSGNGNDATQSTATSQPQIVSSGNVITENGKPAVSFDGSNDQMNVAYSFSNTSISHILVNSYDKDLQTSTYPHFFSGVNTNYSNRLYLQGKTDLYYYSSGSGSSNGNTTGVYGSNIDNSLNIISLSLRNSGAGYSGDFNLNGNSQVAFSNASVPLQSFTSQILGNWNTTGGNTKMNVSEFIQFSSDESANLSGINSLINTYYNIY